MFFWHIFPHLDWIRRGIPYLFVFSANAAKYRPNKFQIQTLFTQCRSLCWLGSKLTIKTPISCKLTPVWYLYCLIWTNCARHSAYSSIVFIYNLPGNRRFCTIVVEMDTSVFLNNFDHLFVCFVSPLTSWGDSNWNYLDLWKLSIYGNITPKKNA